MTSVRLNTLAIVVFFATLLFFLAHYFNHKSCSRPSNDPAEAEQPSTNLGFKTAVISANNVTNTPAVIDPITRIRMIVDGLERSFNKVSPLSLKYGFEWLANATHFFDITPESDPIAAEDSFYQYISKLQLRCPKSVRIGTAEDGGWDACLTGPYNITSPCLVYSIGMGGEWSFDYKITENYGCKDMAFDPTLGKQDYKPRELIFFYNTGLAGVNEVNKQKWRVRTFGQILRELEHLDTTIDILKIDIEYSEWEAFESMLIDGSLSRVKQLMFEFHTKGPHTGVSDYAYYLQILRGLDVLGFKSWRFWENNNHVARQISKLTKKSQTCCGNVNFVNIKYIS